jgi:hypothetical protein
MDESVIIPTKTRELAEHGSRNVRENHEKGPKQSAYGVFSAVPAYLSAGDS